MCRGACAAFHNCVATPHSGVLQSQWAPHNELLACPCVPCHFCVRIGPDECCFSWVTMQSRGGSLTENAAMRLFSGKNNRSQGRGAGPSYQKVGGGGPPPPNLSNWVHLFGAFVNLFWPTKIFSSAFGEGPFRAKIFLQHIWRQPQLRISWWWWGGWGARPTHPIWHPPVRAAHRASFGHFL